MARQIPIVDVAGTSFYVDVLREELRQTDDPGNRISFNVFDQEGNGYTFLYDKSRKNVPLDIASITKLEYPYQWITLPALMELDPEGIALKYDIPLSVLCPGKYMEQTSNLEDDEEDE